MNIGIDLDDTISEGPDFFSLLSGAFLAGSPAGTRRLRLCDREVFELHTCIRALNGGLRS